MARTLTAEEDLHSANFRNDSTPALVNYTTERSGMRFQRNSNEKSHDQAKNELWKRIHGAPDGRNPS